jgi:ferric-dicitrate binding protein FerR (iron transport regulator)
MMSDARLWELLARKYNGEISGEELDELEQLLRQQQHGIQLNELLTDLHSLPIRNMTSAADEAKSREAIQKALGSSTFNTTHATVEAAPEYSLKENKRSFAGWLSAAIVAASVILLLFYFRQEKPEKTLASKAAVPVNEVVTNGGSKSTVHLPDGSFVILNTGSRLVYNKDFGAETRDVYLTGEGFFDVAHNEKIPLVVHAGNIDIKVKGTAFNVRAYTEDSIVEAALIRGSIEVFTQADPERKILLRPNEKIIIGKSSVISSAKKENKQESNKEEVFSLGKLRPNPVDSTIAEIAWIENKLAFYKEPFETLAKKMERWYNVSIEFNDEKLNQLTFTGSFEKEDIVEALNALRQITPFQYSIRNRKVTISKNK